MKPDNRCKYRYISEAKQDIHIMSGNCTGGCTDSKLSVREKELQVQKYELGQLNVEDYMQKNKGATTNVSVHLQQPSVIKVFFKLPCLLIIINECV